MKSSTTPCKLSEIPVLFCYDKEAKHTLLDGILKFEWDFHTANNISLDSAVLYHGAAVSKSGELANNGDFVKIENAEVCFCYIC